MLLLRSHRVPNAHGLAAFFYLRNQDMAQKKLTLTDEQKVIFDALTPLQQKFALGILKGLNQVDAYRKAGGKAKGESARTQASRMITFDNVKTFLDAMNQEAVSDAVMSRQEALERLSHMGRVSIHDIADFRNSQIGEDEEGQPVFQAAWQFKDSKPRRAECHLRTDYRKGRHQVKTP
nr:terminase small subunit [Xenorhabdus beddingii]